MKSKTKRGFLDTRRVDFCLRERDLADAGMGDLEWERRPALLPTS
jgi:hypothetical protein